MLPGAARSFLHRAVFISRTAQWSRRASVPVCHATLQKSFASSAAETGAPVNVSTDHENAVAQYDVKPPLTSSLPSACPGCGAPAQTVAPGEAGYFDLTRNAVKTFLRRRQTSVETGAIKDFLAQANAGDDAKVAQEVSALKKSSDEAARDSQPPACDRCHHLLHHNVGAPIHHPSLTSLRDTIDESPYKYNHIYHVIDAADFPMSILPSIKYLLSANPLRSKNRRARSGTYSQGKKLDISFVITRSDLLAPVKSMVDPLMPHMVEILRDALGRTGVNARLSNVYCVSAKRGWWTPKLKQAIWHHGGAGWMVGKVNVGKSNLFEAVFPKGKSQTIDFERERTHIRLSFPSIIDFQKSQEDTVLQDEDSLLPPARPETSFPAMPTVSALPGTTASPIRIPFGKGRGELIDLPGLQRSELENYVRPEHRDKLVMEKRVSPEQYNLKAGHSLLLGGGLIRITPRTEDLTFLVYPFVPIHAAVRTDQEVADNLPTSSAHSIAAEGVAQSLKSAGIFQLKTDVTKQRAGPLTRRDAAGIKPINLPFKVLSTEIVIESLGWVEIVAQVRRKAYPDDEKEGSGLPYPEIEVFAPKEDFIQARRSLSLWELGKPKRAPQKRQRVVYSKLKASRK